MNSDQRKPLLFLDVDGVLNTFGMKRIKGTVHDTEGGPCHVPDGTAERVARLVEVYQPVWATAWLGAAHRVWSRLLDLDPLPWGYVEYSDYKVTEIIKAAKGRRWAWVDDDADWELSNLGWTRQHVDGLILSPDPHIGLADEHIDVLLNYAREGAHA